MYRVEPSINGIGKVSLIKIDDNIQGISIKKTKV